MDILPKPINRLIGQALHDYQMLSDGDRILIGVSGGVDSLVLTWLLQHWQKKAPIKYQIMALHLDMGFDDSQYLAVEAELGRIGAAFRTERTQYGVVANQQQPDKACHQCATARRNHLFETARSEQYTAIALGHHKDDLIETFFLNMLYSGNLSTMMPKQQLFDGRLKIVRPMAYLTKDQIHEIANIAGIVPVKNPCPMADKSKREEIRNLMASLYQRDPRFRGNIFAAMGNVRTDYLLKVE
ncbi:MAG: tRNA 2-thiocytidine biosynthesis protein TtcA [Proteobacteria bacterium]|nr:tRNA 2-thiocytidine biosynthesis protein TtcA [Desulfobulbaceae bacterium]MBU4153769.1 tRNA 2-thiocytidine biosynthesis protein TtcA [Pseudomonadota bacterium]MDP2104872.1 ATP-binding protein [Desulfobulbaceae bacterium]